MHLSSEGGGGNRVGGHGGSGGVWGSVLLRQGSWRTVPETGQVTLSDQVLGSIVNTDPVEKWYKLDREPIARGQFATVYHCQHRSTGEEFAVKFASRRRLGLDATPDIVHEIAVNAILAPCTRNVKLRDVFTTDAAFVLIMEYAPGGDLQTLLDENLVPYERDVVAFLRQLLEGLVFIHDRGIVHLDIKPQNLVLMGDFPDCAVKLCDFEISRMLTPGYEVREILGTPDYVAPEILHYEAITTSTDMWSLGVLTYVLLTGFLPFGGDNDQETFMQISRGELDFPNELFEDITPEAIDFMKRLLIREPGKRMSARECLCHPWIKKHMTRAVPLQTLDLHTTTVIPHHHAPPVCRAESSPSVIVTTTAATEANAKTPDENYLNTSNTNVTEYVDKPDSTSNEASATTVQPVTGRPPLHPRSSLKSMSVTSDVATDPFTATNGVTPLSAITPFLNKESRTGSRQNLNRLRSLSKSREVLSERIQMSNLKKTLSKSRERLYDAKLGMSASREHLNSKSLSQSVEALTALTQLHQNGALYNSCNNIFIPMINIANKQCGSNMPNRMYQSMASINQIPGNDLSKKMGYFESRFTADDDYNDLITRRNTSLNMVISNTPADPTPRLTAADEAKAGSLRGNPCRGGRGAEGCDRVCTRHVHKQPEPQSMRKLSVTNKANKMRKDAQKRKKERKERELRETERNRRKSSSENKSADKTPNEGSASPQLRKGSVCHVEQRLQERHERLLEKQEREARKLSVSEKRRLNSDDREPSQTAEKTKTCKKSESQVVASGERKRSITVGSRRKSSADSPKSSDVSEASSMESITGSIENIQSRENGIRRKSRSLISPSITNTVENKNRSSSDVNDNLVSTKNCEVPYIKHVEEQEHEEQIKSQSTTENFTKVILTDSTKTATDTQLKNQALCVTVSSPTNSTKENFICNITETSKSADGNSHEKIKKPERRASVIMSELASIKEENGNGRYCRTTSTSSDVGSTISEESEENNNQIVLEIESKIAENKARSRSLSVQPNTCHLVVPRTRNRSHSVHQYMEDKARPWGDVCSGSIAKALKNFSIQEDSSYTVPKASPDPATRLSTLSLPPENDSE